MNRFVLLGLAVLLQLVVLTWEYVGSRWPVWTGERVTLAVRPVDPRSWFAGNYAFLSYDIASLPGELYRGSELSLREGEVVYVSLEKRGNEWGPTELTLEPPQSGLFIRGRLSSSWYASDRTVSAEPEPAQLGWRGFSPGSFRVRYGIEAYFAPKERALAIERAVANTALESGPEGELGPDGLVRAHVAVSSSGKAALVDVEVP